MGIGSGIYLRPGSEVTRPCRARPASGFVRVRGSLVGVRLPRWHPAGGTTRRRAAGSARQAGLRRGPALAGSPLCGALDRFLPEWIDGEATRGGIRRDPPDGPLHLRRDPPVEARRHVLGGESARKDRREDEADGESGGPHSVCVPGAPTATTLLRRPKPSSTAGAAGSTTQRAPSTTNAY